VDLPVERFHEPIAVEVGPGKRRLPPEGLWLDHAGLVRRGKPASTKKRRARSMPFIHAPSDLTARRGRRGSDFLAREVRFAPAVRAQIGARDPLPPCFGERRLDAGKRPPTIRAVSPSKAKGEEEYEKWGEHQQRHKPNKELAIHRALLRRSSVLGLP
jgi:hypothetical protein